MSDEYTEIEGELITETDHAWLVEVVRPGEKKPTQAWLPKARCTMEREGVWEIPMWLANRERLV